MTASVMLTPTASEHFRAVLRYTKQKYGSEHMQKYSALLKQGLNEIPSNHKNDANKRLNLKEGTGFELQHVQHYYVVYKIIRKNIFVIVAIFHHNMDIPKRLKEIQNLSDKEIAILKNRLTVH